jgi:hypothetical protein
VLLLLSRVGYCLSHVTTAPFTVADSFGRVRVCSVPAAVPIAAPVAASGAASVAASGAAPVAAPVALPQAVVVMNSDLAPAASTRLAASTADSSDDIIMSDYASAVPPAVVEPLAIPFNPFIL